ncbi:retrovirus-related Pol polyprotein from transposon RE2 isoform X1 [Humulus lupulus]|uniref:retrovirus-related Pol polyprotein from transposon RE2 isoform X1 n=1 Tax=Humulus lupulus TaxID=3486 RepID=UPI002B4045C9|nr:retrovirus-related Pol polyprotein from transposon RE2 isoform X1 [Humulus lupulus]XP_062073502.1 retrovirus-related Pol polyprotein from transposon RE2 isoform X1 [Humulus lupulus]
MCMFWVQIAQNLTHVLFKCVFLGYSSTRKGYKCYHPSTRRMYTMSPSMKSNFFYYTTSLQGGTVSEVSGWDTCLPKAILDFAIHPSFDQSSQQPLSQSSQQTLSQPITKEVIVYDRRNRNHQVIQSTTEPPPHESDSRTTPNVSNPSLNSILPNEIPNSTEEHEAELPIAKRKGVRSCTVHPISKYVCYSKLTPQYKAFLTKVEQEVVPRDITEALSREEWKKAVYEEIGALENNTTWTIVTKLEDKHVVGCKWVFIIKHRAYGTIDRYKARLVAKGFTQTYGVDYKETFAPVAKLNTVRVLLSFAANLNWPLQQLDIKNAFLNGHGEKEVYMKIPLGFEERYGKGRVCHLKKSLYGLKQSPRT